MKQDTKQEQPETKYVEPLNKNRDLETLVAELRKSNLRRYTCLNDMGYSQVERDIVDELTKPYKKQIGELVRALQDAVAFAEKCYKADKDSADWYNNNTPGVGQKLDYQNYPPLPKWVENAKQVLKEAGLTE